MISDLYKMIEEMNVGKNKILFNTLETEVHKDKLSRRNNTFKPDLYINDGKKKYLNIVNICLKYFLENKKEEKTKNLINELLTDEKIKIYRGMKSTTSPSTGKILTTTTTKSLGFYHEIEDKNSTKEAKEKYYPSLYRYYSCTHL